MRIAVTAASGRLGHAILRRLPEEVPFTDIVAVARDPARVRVDGIEKRAGDYADPAQMTAALRGIHTLIMISAPVAGGSDRVGLHRNVIDAARKAGVVRLMYTSVIGNGLEADTWFGPTQQANRQTEADLQDSGLQWVIGRNGLYLELDLAQMRKAAATGVYSNPAGEGRCPYLTIDELGYAWARLVSDDRHAGQIYNLGGQAHTQAELVSMANEVFGLSLRYEAISDEACLAKFRLLMAERGEAVARMLTGVFQGIRAGAYEVPSHFEAATGRPCKPVRQMMAECRAQVPG